MLWSSCVIEMVMQHESSSDARGKVIGHNIDVAGAIVALEPLGCRDGGDQQRIVGRIEDERGS